MSELFRSAEDKARFEDSLDKLELDKPAEQTPQSAHERLSQQNERPVEVEVGREVYEKTKQVIEEFKQIIPTLGLGEKTRQNLEEIIKGFAKLDDAGMAHMVVFDNDRARFADHGYRAKHHFGEEPKLEMSESVVHFEEKILTAFGERIGFEFSPEELEDLAYRGIIWHELGHAIQYAYEQAGGYTEDGIFHLANQDLKEATFAAGISEPFLEVPDVFNYRRMIESERFAEGFAYMLLIDELRRRGAELSDDAEAQLRGVRQHSATFKAVEQAKGDWELLQKLLFDSDATINDIGYARAHDREAIRKILALTN